MPGIGGTVRAGTEGIARPVLQRAIRPAVRPADNDPLTGLNPALTTPGLTR